jgi:uncharacterized membrane protein
MRRSIDDHPAAPGDIPPGREHDLGPVSWAVAMSISTVSAKLAVSTMRRPNLASAHRTMSCGVARSSWALAAATCCSVSAGRRSTATGVAAAAVVVVVAVVVVLVAPVEWVSSELIIPVKSDRFNQVSANLPRISSAYKTIPIIFVGIRPESHAPLDRRPPRRTR